MGEETGERYERIRLIVRRSRGVDLSHYRPSYVDRRIRARMRARGAADQPAYCRLLGSDPDEIARLVEAISTGVTSFFRDPGLYTWIDGHILPALLEGRPGRTIRIWSAGCATGEETWSLAALAAGREKPPPDGRIRVLGTDVDRQAILAARRGEYPLAVLRQVPVDLQRRLLEIRREEGRCSVAQALRAYATFRVENLDRKPPAGAFDLVLCRNVLIYFDTVLQERIHEQFAAAIRPGGWLALGRVERVTGPARRSFEMVHARERIYRRI